MGGQAQIEAGVSEGKQQIRVCSFLAPGCDVTRGMEAHCWAHC